MVSEGQNKYLGQTEGCMKENGKEENNMEKECTGHLKEKYVKENGEKAKKYQIQNALVQVQGLQIQKMQHKQLRSNLSSILTV